MAGRPSGLPFFLLPSVSSVGSVANMEQEEVVISRPPRSSQILTLESGNDGVPHAVTVTGFVKCMICQGSSHNHLICEECRASVIMLRSAGASNMLARLLELIDRRPYMIDVLERMTDEVVGLYLYRQVTGHDLPDTN